MKTFRSTLIMFVLVGGFALYAYFGVFKKQQQETESKDKQSVIFKNEKEKITKVTVVKDAQVIELVKDGADWKLTAPIADSADGDAVSGFVDSLLAEKSEDEITDKDLDYSVFGLDKPVHTISIEADGKATKVSVGRDAIGGKVYVRRDDEPKVLIANATWKGFGEKSAKDLRNKALYRLTGKSVSTVLIENATESNKQKVRLSQKDGKWSIDSLGEAEVSSSEVQNYITQIENLKATEVAAEDKSVSMGKFNLAKPMVRVTFGFADSSEPYTLTVSSVNKTQEAFVIANSLKPVYKIFGASAQQLSKVPNDFRDKTKPFQFQRSDVKEIEVKTDLAQVDIINKDGKWQLKTDNPAKEVDQTQVDSFISQVYNFKAKDFTRDQNLNAKKTLALKDGTGKVIIELGWADPLKDKFEYKVKSSLSKEIVTLEAPVLNSLPIQTLVKDKSATAANESVPPEGKGSVTDTHTAGEDDGHGH
jgi:hypothetical protein